MTRSLLLFHARYRGPSSALQCTFYRIQTNRTMEQEVSVAIAAATYQRTLFLGRLDDIRILSVR